MGSLDRRRLAIVRELSRWREGVAAQTNRPARTIVRDDLLVEIARRNPTRFLWWRSVGISKEERDAVMQMISERQPKLIVVQEVAATQKTRDFIGQYYRRLGAVADLAVYERD